MTILLRHNIIDQPNSYNEYCQLKFYKDFVDETNIKALDHCDIIPVGNSALRLVLTPEGRFKFTKSGKGRLGINANMKHFDQKLTCPNSIKLRIAAVDGNESILLDADQTIWVEKKGFATLKVEPPRKKPGFSSLVVGRERLN